MQVCSTRSTISLFTRLEGTPTRSTPPLLLLLMRTLFLSLPSFLLHSDSLLTFALPLGSILIPSLLLFLPLSLRPSVPPAHRLSVPVLSTHKAHMHTNTMLYVSDSHFAEVKQEREDIEESSACDWERPPSGIHPQHESPISAGDEQTGH